MADSSYNMRKRILANSAGKIDTCAAGDEGLAACERDRPSGQDFVPFGDRVLVKQDAESEAEAKSGLIEIPESQKEPPLEGLVKAVGDGRWEYGAMVRPEAEVGDHVLFGRYAGTPIWINGEEYLLLRDEEIVGRRLEPPSVNTG